MTPLPQSTTTTTNTITSPGHTSTITASAATTYVTQYPCPVPLKKRDLEERAVHSTPTWAASVCTATTDARSATVAAEARLSSACSCFGVAASTPKPATITTTTSTQLPDTTVTITPTVTSTRVNPFHPSPTPLIQNGNFEDQYSHWAHDSTTVYDHLQFVKPAYNGSYSMQMDITSAGGDINHATDVSQAVWITQDVPPMHMNYQYMLRFKYRALMVDGNNFHCELSAAIGSHQLPSQVALTHNGASPDGDWSDAAIWSDQNGSSDLVYGPLKFMLSCYYEKVQPVGTAMASVQVDELGWMAEVGCTPK